MTPDHDALPSEPARVPIDADVAAFLTRLCGPAAPAPIVTHAACVFLGEGEAYKVKRPVRFSYLDYSTAAKRRAACEQEWRLNVVAAPDLYLGVSTITRRRDGALGLDEPGAPVETLVRMRRFPQSALFEALARDGRLTRDLTVRLAEVIRDSHAAAPVARGHHVGDGLFGVLDDLERGFARVDAAALGRDPAPILAQCRAVLTRSADALRRRAAAGAVRRCHGDLHLRNIVLWRGAPVLFDALEFSDALARVDVLYDLAFPLMDLRRLGLTERANTLLNAYLDGAAPDALEGLGALGAMMALRAGVRARVAVDRAPPHPADAVDHLALAEQLVAPTAPALIAVGGLSGSGKSHLARAFAPRLPGPCGAVWLRSDVERKAMVGVAPLDPAPAEAYAPAVTEAVYARLRAKAERVVEEGGVALVDAVHARPQERDALEAVASAHGARFVGVWLECAEAERARRVAERRGDASDASADIARAQTRYNVGDVRWRRVDAAQNAEAVLDAALACARPPRSHA